MTARPPLRYSPSLEVPEDDEAETTAELIETLLDISRKTYEDGGHGLRSVHAKSHALLRGQLVIPSDLPPHLAQGLFARPGQLDAVVRISTTPGDLLDDSVSTPRGLALKVIGVQGEQLSGNPADTTQDFVLVNSPTFLSPTAKSFLQGLKLLAATTDRGPGLKKVLSAAMRGAERLVEATGHESGAIKAFGGHPETHPLGETYHSQAAIRYGDHVAKVSLSPRSDHLTALAQASLDVSGHPDGLREAMLAFFAAHPMSEWDLRVQLNTDLEKMPIENASIAWPDDLSPHVPVATLRVPNQVAWSAARSAAVDDGMSFSPWHGLVAHQPLGVIMRVRRRAYEASAAHRALRNGRSVDEPRSLEGLAG